MSLLMTPGKLERLLETAHERLAELEDTHAAHAKACFKAGYNVGYFNGRHNKQILKDGPEDAYELWSSDKEMT